MNVFTFTGRLGRDAEQKTIPTTGTAICELAVAFDSGFGERKTSTWIKAILWGKRAEGGLVPYLIKGQQVAISGELTNRQYEKKDGTKGFSLELRINEIDLIGPKQEKQQYSPPVSQPAQPAATGTNYAAAKYGAAPMPEDFDDSIPF